MPADMAWCRAERQGDSARPFRSRARWARLRRPAQAIVAVPCAIRQMKRSTPPRACATFDRVRVVARAAREACRHPRLPPDLHRLRAATGVAACALRRLLGGMRFIERPFCERLGTPFAVDLGVPLLSPAAIADPPVFERARAVARIRRHRASARAPAQVQRPARTGRGARGHDGPRRRGADAGGRRDRAGAAPSLAALAAPFQSGHGPRPRGRRARAACRATLSSSPASSARAAGRPHPGAAAARICRARSACRTRRSRGSKAGACCSSTMC